MFDTIILEHYRIFSGNEAAAYGGAVYTTTGTLTVKGCTFYNNRVTGTSTTGSGGAIRAGGPLYLLGNLFSGNTAGHTGNVVYGPGYVTSYGYNVSDKEDGVITGTGSSVTNRQTASGYAFNTGDVGPVTDMRFDGNSKPSSATTGLKTLTTLPDAFPATYFDGTARTTPATAGAMKAD